MQVVEILEKDKGLFVLHSQYHVCWRPGNIRCQGISIHGIDLVLLGYSGFNISGVKGKRHITSDLSIHPDISQCASPSVTPSVCLSVDGLCMDGFHVSFYLYMDINLLCFYSMNYQSINSRCADIMNVLSVT